MLNTPEIELSVLRGVRYTFHDEGHKIEFLGSAWTGKEIVTADGTVVSEHRSFAKNTAHEFQLGITSYSLTYSTKSIMGGGWACSLFRNGDLLRRYEVGYENGNKYIGWIALAIGIGFGLLFTNFPEQLVYTLPIFALTLFVLNKFRRSMTYQIHDEP